MICYDLLAENLGAENFRKQNIILFAEFPSCFWLSEKKVVALFSTLNESNICPSDNNRN